MHWIRTRAVRGLFAFAIAGILAGVPVSAQESGSSKPPASALDLARQLNQAFVQVAEQVSPAVVVIRVAYNPAAEELGPNGNPYMDRLNELFEQMPELRKQLEEFRNKMRRDPSKKPERQKQAPPPGPRRFTGRGSGVVVRKEGYILTNRHVVDGAEKIQVQFKDDYTWYDAEVRGVDAQSDVAVIKVDPKDKSLQVAKLGRSENVRVGEFAIAIGAPFDLDYSVTFGHISAKSRSDVLYSTTMDQDFLQTDADINPGNSGGPLVNIEGEVIGINTLIRGINTGIGFAIPIDLAREVADKLITDGKFVRAYLGVRIAALRDEVDLRESLQGVKDGVVVKEIPPEGPAAKSELKAGDVITFVDGKAVGTAAQLKNQIRSKPIGAPVTLDVCRNGKNLKIQVKPEAWPEETVTVSNHAAPEPEEAAQALGLTVQQVTPELAAQFGVEKAQGVIVTEVEQGSVAELKGLRAGDIITDVNDQTINSPGQFKTALKGMDLKKGVRLIYLTRGTSKFVILKESGD